MSQVSTCQILVHVGQPKVSPEMAESPRLSNTAIYRWRYKGFIHRPRQSEPCWTLPPVMRAPIYTGGTEGPCGKETVFLGLISSFP